MQWQGLKIHVIVISVLISLAFFFGAQWLYNSLNYREPLKNKLDSNSNIVDYRVEETDDGLYRLIVDIRETDNLMLTYREINDSVKQVMGKRSFVIELVDRPNKALNETLYQGGFAIQEALVRGNFREMARSLDAYAEQRGAHSRVYIDDTNIYWHLTQGDNYVYEIVPRQQSTFVYSPGDTVPERR